jgi:5'-3' exonuclease
LRWIYLRYYTTTPCRKSLRPLVQFIELCILLGCDYLEPIKGVGPKSALKLLKEHGSLEAVVEHLREKQASREDAEEEDGKKKKGGVHIPEDWPWEKAKELFLKPDVTPADDLEVLVSCFLVRYHEADEVIVGVESTGC